MCSQAHLLTYANKCCTSEHFVSRSSLGLRLALLLGVNQHSISLLTACARARPALPEQALLSFPQTQPRTFPCVEGQSQAQLLSGCCSQGRSCKPGSGLDWQKEHLLLPSDCSDGVPDPGNTPAVSCSSLELKQALFTLTTALKGKIKVDFEVVEFTHQFGFLHVCGIELWAPE